MSGGALHVAVLGAGGTIAPAIVRELAESEEVGDLLLLDVDGERAARVAERHGGDRARAAAVDAREGLAAMLDGSDVLVNAASYRVNLVAMQAALDANCDYGDLGGLYWMTSHQLELHGRFQRAGRLAVLGMGSSPGLTSVMAVRAVRALGAAGPVHALHVATAGRDPEPATALRVPYALRTLLDELTMAPVVLADGEPRELEPLAPGGIVRFPDPIGDVATIHTLHSALRTFGTSFGVREASCRLSLPAGLLRRLQELRDAADDEVAAAQAAAVAPSARAVSAHVVVASSADGRSASVSALTEPMAARGLGGAVVATAAPAAALVRLLARGHVRRVGVHPPEKCVDPDDLLPELERRGCRFEVTVT